MHERQAGLHRRVVEVGEEAAHLRGHQHALYIRWCATTLSTRRRSCPQSAGLASAARSMVRRHTYSFALERLTCVNVGGTAQERLQNGGHARLCGGTEVVRVDGHLAPEHQRDAALRAPSSNVRCVAHARRVVVREEEHGHAVIAPRRAAAGPPSGPPCGRNDAESGTARRRRRRYCAPSRCRRDVQGSPTRKARRRAWRGFAGPSGGQSAPMPHASCS